jgi:hypothetical protein
MPTPNVIDKAVYFQNLDGSSTTNYSDLYKRYCFVLEAKQGSNPLQNSAVPLTSAKEPRRMKRGTSVRGTHGWDEAMLAACVPGRTVRESTACFGGLLFEDGSRDLYSGFQPHLAVV